VLQGLRLLAMGWALALALASPVRAEGSRTLVVSPQGPYATLARALEEARPGDTVEVRGGIHPGPVVVDKPLRLLGVGWPVLDGGGRGTVLKITAPDVTVQGFVIRNSGDSLDEENSGIAVVAPRARIEGNRLEDTLFGIYLRQAHGTVLRNNRIRGKDLPVPRRGDLIRVWYSNDVVIEGNRAEQGRDIVLWYSERLTVRGNRVEGGRYGLHFMYCDDAIIEGNTLADNSVGAFLMYSRRLHLRQNLLLHNRGPSGYGMGLKDMDDPVAEENLILDNRVGIFVDNSPREMEGTAVFRRNLIAFNDVGVLLLPSVRRNFYQENAFVDNGEQVQIGGGGRLLTLEWRGNHWSDYAGYDANGDGVGDLPYRAQRLFENLMDRYPEVRLFIYSPSAQALEFAARAMPFLRPEPKLEDPLPAMRPLSPEGAPPPPPLDPRPIGLAGAGLTLLGLGLLLWPRRPPRPVPASPPSTLKPLPGGGPMVRVENLVKRFGPTVVLQGISLAVERGQAVAFWGPNGAGKTTLLRCILGVLPFEEGRVEVAGLDIRRQGKSARRLIGFVPQELNLHDEMTVEETLSFYARLRGTPAGRADALLERMGLAEHRHKAVRHLSGGMKQRLALALALLSDPEVLVLDEPTASLDIRARADFLALLAHLKGQGKTLLFASHRREDVAMLADQVFLLEGGRLVREERGLERRVRLLLRVPPESAERAVALLSAEGLSAQPNGHRVWVEAPAGRKAWPIALLAREGIPVEDFALEAEE